MKWPLGKAVQKGMGVPEEDERSPVKVKTRRD